MTKTYSLGRLAGLEISARTSVLPAFLLLWGALGAAGYFLLSLTPWQALLGGLAAALLHYVSDLWHQLCHALTARQTGHPMVGIRFWGPLSTSLYPRDEGRLPARIHIRRALGGPAGSLLLTLLSGWLYLALRPDGGTREWLAAFLFLDNLLVLTLGALLPLGFTDGSSLLFWIRQD